MEKGRIEFMKRAGESENLSPLGRKLLLECVKAVEDLAQGKVNAEQVNREKNDEVLALRREVGEVLQEQRVLQYGIENYPTMWLGNWPRLKTAVAAALRELEAGQARKELKVETKVADEFERCFMCNRPRVEAPGCETCEGSGRVVVTDDGAEPWPRWERLPPGSDLAIRTGLLKPQICPTCEGRGK